MHFNKGCLFAQFKYSEHQTVDSLAQSTKDCSKAANSRLFMTLPDFVFFLFSFCFVCVCVCLCCGGPVKKKQRSTRAWFTTRKVTVERRVVGGRAEKKKTFLYENGINKTGAEDSKLKYKRENKKRDRQADRQTGRQTDRQRVSELRELKEGIFLGRLVRN